MAAAKYQIKIGYGLRTMTGATFTKANVYEVVSVKNTTEYSPGQRLDKRQVDELCKSHAWDVTVVPLREEDE